MDVFSIFCRNMHYPPETCSIVLIARIFAIVSQASYFSLLILYSFGYCLQRASIKGQCSFPWESAGGSRKDEMQWVIFLVSFGTFMFH